MWSRFVHDWNSTLRRNPSTVVATFLASQSSTWVCLYGGFSALPKSVLAPELAVGWMTSRLTRKFRQPLNLALAAAIVRVVPAISDLKVTPLVTGFVPDSELKKKWAERRALLVQKYPFMDAVFSKAKEGAEWLNGPVDTYGLAFYLSGKATSLATLLVTTGVVRQGVDVVSIMTSWGLSGDFSDALANMAGSGACNTAFTPLHFAMAVYGTHAQEWIAHQRRSNFAEEDRDEGESDRERYSDDEEKSAMGQMSTILLCWTLGVTFFALREMKKKSSAVETSVGQVSIDNDENDKYFPGREFEPLKRHIVLKEEALVAPVRTGSGGEPGRVILVGDVHGCFDELQDLLAKIAWNPRNDTVVLLGDLVNKGPKSCEVVRWARHHAVYAVRGNHDDSALAVVRRRGKYDPSSPDHTDEVARSMSESGKWAWTKDLSTEDIEWMEQLPYSISIPSLDILAVHAGIVPGVPLEQQRRKDLTSMRNLEVVANQSLDDRKVFYRAKETTTKNSTAWAKLWEGPTHIVFGHDAVRRLQREAFATGLDTGCLYGGHLSALLLPSNEVCSVKSKKIYQEAPLSSSR